MTFRGLVLSAVVGLTVMLFSGSGIASTYNEGFLAAEAGNYKSALSEWGPLAQKGHAIAQFNLGLLYHSGSGVQMDEGKAVQLYQASAEAGYHKAQEFLAVGYAEGWFGLPKDTTKAAYWEQRLNGE